MKTGTKKTVSILLAVLLSIVCIYANGKSESPKEVVTIEAALGMGEWLDGWEVLEKRFEAAYPWINVEAVGVGELTDDFISARLAANDLPDLLQVNNNTLTRDMIDEGLLADLSRFEAAAHIPESYKDAFTYKGILFGFTQGAAFSTLYINMNVLRKAGWNKVPANWNEFVDCCNDIKNKTKAAPLVVGGKNPTTCWMLFESIVANACGDEIGFGTYEKQMLNGTFDFTKYPKIQKMLFEVSQFLLKGSASLIDDDVVAALNDGTAAMALAGNWTAGAIFSGNQDIVCALPPFNAPSGKSWITVSPETGYGLSAQKEKNQKVIEARNIFFEWLFKPENFALNQNYRGTVPVLQSLTPDLIKLPEQIAKIVPEMNKANYVTMGFNLWTPQFADTACTALRDVYAGNMKAEDALTKMSKTLKESHVK
ncbi:carbohydrate ABC transporter substrate-binding protein [Treponema sp. OMZ 840]|uniref:ABC transporter substrate-binding protein n=1 Tax=Treponema sp. OMZ 840 TaxID=244313 RepID=UPI003D9209CC